MFWWLGSNQYTGLQRPRCYHYTTSEYLHGYQDSNSKQRFWRPLWYHFTIPVFGGNGGYRTPYAKLFRLALYHLSYITVFRSPSQNRTDECKFCRLLPSHLAIGPWSSEGVRNPYLSHTKGMLCPDELRRNLLQRPYSKRHILYYKYSPLPLEVHWIVVE